MIVNFVWQGSYEPSMGGPGSVLGWNPTAGGSYFLMVQPTASSGGNNTRGVSVNLVDQTGTSVLTTGPQSSQVKSESGGPATVPMIYLKWVTPGNWSPGESVWITVNAETPPGAGSTSVLNSGSDFVSATVIEVDQLPEI